MTGKLDKILDAQVLLRSAFLKDLPAKIFSLVTQKQDPNVMETVEAVEKTSRNYKKLLRKFKRDNNQVFELPTLKAVISEMEGNNELDGEPMYQGQRLKYYRRGKQYIADYCVYLVESIINCYNEPRSTNRAFLLEFEFHTTHQTSSNSPQDFPRRVRR